MLPTTTKQDVHDPWRSRLCALSTLLICLQNKYWPECTLLLQVEHCISADHGQHVRQDCFRGVNPANEGFGGSGYAKSCFKHELVQGGA